MVVAVLVIAGCSTGQGVATGTPALATLPPTPSSSPSDPVPSATPGATQSATPEVIGVRIRGRHTHRDTLG